MVLGRISSDTENEAYFNADHARMTFAAALNSIRNAAEIALGGKVEITAICIPEHFDFWFKTAVHDAARESSLAIHRPWQINRSLNLFRLAYELDSCERFGLKEGEWCDIEDVNFVLYVDLKSKTVDLSVADVQTIGAFPELHNRIDAVGQDHFDFDKIRSALNELITSYFDGLKPRHDRLDYLRAIVLSGDVSDRAMGKLRGIIEDVFPGHKGKIHDSINPSFVGAVGAARLAKFYARNPQKLEMEVSYSHGQGPHHDEL